MKNLLIAISLLIASSNANAQVNPRAVRTDTSKTTRIVATGQTQTIPVIKRTNRNTPINSRVQVPILGVGGDPNTTAYTDDPKFIAMIGEISKNNLPVNVTLTPSNPCIDVGKCVVFNEAITEIRLNEQYWKFLKNHDRNINEAMNVLLKLQPDKDYLLVMDIDLKTTSEGFHLVLQGFGLSGLSGQYHPVLVPSGRSNVSFIIHTNADYKFEPNHMQAGSSVLIHPKYKNDQTYKYWFHMYSIKVKELNL